MSVFNLGPMPGTRLDEAADIIASETGDLKTIPTMPARGVTGTQPAVTCALLHDVHVDLGPRALSITPRPQIFTHRLRDQLQWDLDELQQHWTGTVLFAILGPWSLLSALELGNGHRALTDPGARRDLPQILKAGVEEHAANLHQRFGGEVDVIVNEPVLKDLAAGTLPGTSDLDIIAPIPEEVLDQSLSRWLGGQYYLRSSLPHLGTAGVHMINLADLTGSAALDMVGERVAAGNAISLGVGLNDTAMDIVRLWDTLGLDPATLPATLHPAQPLTTQPARVLQHLGEVDDNLRRG